MSEPVTTVFTWEVEPGREQEFEEWLRRVNRAAVGFPGHQGVTWIAPERPGGHYHALLRFSDTGALERWLGSPERDAVVAELDGIATEADRRVHTTGMETWFSLPRTAVTPPPRWKMALVSFSAVYPCVLVFTAFTGPLLADWPLPLRTVVLPAVMAPLLTYALMPALSRLLRKWLYPEL
ncbi:antibiotic biosynthesis monooxygenase [Nocardiopsis sp. CC223A]|uniref:antibiotic biosynthesis monooxygenase n=1 Tax=Nocardiopsis sp. CC223A TaxID=3044051 RepID=UPI00278C7947|nr:antibiotic biosynthesis monooxygenase [Nocardiopsis sp. CC223A]